VRQRETQDTASQISFRDCYSGNVLKEARDDFVHARWSEAFRGFQIGVKYDLAQRWNTLCSRMKLAKFKLRTALWNAVNNLKRLITGRSFGIMTAVPNPIEVSDVSGAGTTTLKWKVFGAPKIELRIDSPSGQVIHTSGPTGQLTTGNWIANDMVFYLLDASGDSSTRDLRTLSRVQIKITDGNKFTL
jgi:hypothetical protein